jgi:hypothetical protein
MQQRVVGGLLLLSAVRDALALAKCMHEAVRKRAQPASHLQLAVLGGG